MNDNWTPEQITSVLSAAATLLTIILSAGAFILGVFNYQNSRRGIDSGLNKDLSEIAEREAEGRRKIQEEFDAYKVKTDKVISEMQGKMDAITRGEYELRTRVRLDGKEPVILTNEIVSINYRASDPAPAS